jgi:hypothetical protein
MNLISAMLPPMCPADGKGKRYEVQRTKCYNSPQPVADGRGISQILWDVIANLVVEGVKWPSPGGGEGRRWNETMAAV